MRSKILFIFIGFILFSASRAGASAHAVTFERVTVDSTIEQITIKRSGFMEDDELIIRYRKPDYEIVEVIDKGETVPESDFHEYEHVLWTYLDLRAVERLAPRVARIRRVSRDGRRHLDLLEREHVERVRRELDSLRSRLSDERIRHSEERRRHSDLLLEQTLQMERQMERVRSRLVDVELEHEHLETFLDALIEENIIPSRKKYEIKFREGICRVNGKRVSDEQAERIKMLYEEIVGRKLDEDRFMIINK